MTDAPSTPTRIPLRVLVKGASTAIYTSWMGGPRSDFAWPRVIEHELYGAGHVAEVRCTAVPAEPVRLALRTWQQEVLTWSPDVIVLQYGHLETIHLFLPRVLERHANSLRGRPLRGRLFYRNGLLKPTWKLLSRVQRAVDGVLPPDLLTFKPKRAKADLRQFIQHARTVASPLVLIAEIPLSGTPYRKWFPGSVQRIETMNQALRDLVEEFDEPDIRFVAVNEVTDALLEPGQDTLPDGGHYTPELHRAVGACLADVIVGWAEKQEHLDVPVRRKPPGSRMRVRTSRSGPATVVSLLVLVLLALGGGTTVAAAVPTQIDGTSPAVRASIADRELGWGESSTVRGSGFAPGGGIQLILYASGTVLADITAGGDGTFATTVTIPRGLGSSTEYVIAVQGPGADGLYGYVTVPLTILGPTPIISIDSKDLAWDEVTTVRGERYEPGATITVSLFPENRPLATVTVNGDGRFAADVRIPSNIRSALDYQVVVTGQGIDKLFHFDAIEVAIIGDRPSISVSSDRAERGGRLGVTGTRFLADSVATVTLLPGYETLGEVAVSPDGTFSRQVRIPEDAFAPDPHLIVVTGFGADGLFLYATASVSLEPPVDVSTDATVGTLPFGDPDGAGPDFDRFVDRYLGAPPERGGSNRSIAGLVILFLLAVILLVLILTSRRRRTPD